jgi:hypothetical protein
MSLGSKAIGASVRVCVSRSQIVLAPLMWAIKTHSLS